MSMVKIANLAVAIFVTVLALWPYGDPHRGSWWIGELLLVISAACSWTGFISLGGFKNRRDD